jgi:glutathione S-transferase
MLGSSVVFLRAFGMLPASPMLEAYADRCLARPGYQRALALDEAGGV